MNEKDDVVRGLRAVGRMLGVSYEAVRKMVADKRLPPPIAQERGGVWRRSDIEAWTANPPLAARTSLARRVRDRNRYVYGWREIAKMAFTSYITARRMVESGRLPQPVCRGACDVWLRSDVQAAVLRLDPRNVVCQAAKDLQTARILALQNEAEVANGGRDHGQARLDAAVAKAGDRLDFALNGLYGKGWDLRP